MAVLRESDLPDFLKKKSSRMNGLLLFGNDGSAISTAARQVVLAMSDGEEPLRLDASNLKSDPAALDDAFRSMSLLGDRRIIVVDGVDDSHLIYLQSIVDASVVGNFVLMLAESLKKTSKLRTSCEASQLLAVVAFYEEAGSALLQRVLASAESDAMVFEEGAAERFVELSGSDRSIVMAELAKLKLYCWPNKSIALDDVEASCGDQAAFESDGLILAMLDGDIESMDRMFSSMRDSGDVKSLLIMVQMHLARLEHVSAALARGSDMASACRSAKPPFFDKQQSTAARHLRFVSGDDLGRAQISVQAAILQSRQMADLGEAITARCLLSLGRMFRQLRLKAAA